jgi:hypothetical protein
LLPVPPGDGGAGCLKVTPKQSDCRRAANGPGPPTVRWEIEEITGPEGREVAAAQASAIEELLRWWINRHRTKEPDMP